jgi:hypothetical protein
MKPVMDSEPKSIFSELSFDLIREILLYNSYFVIRRNKQLVFIDKILKEDFRYLLLNSIPKIQKFGLDPDILSVTIWKHDKKYVLRHFLRPSLIWEYSFVVYSKDPHSNMMDSVPYSMICIPRY